MSGFDFDNHPDESREDRRRGRGAVIIVLATLLVLLLVVVLVLVGPIKNLLGGSNTDYTGAGTGTVTVVVHDGDGASAIGDTLASDGVVRSSSAFVSAAAANPRSRGIAPGTYRLHHHMQASLAVALLLKPSSRVDFPVTITEGMTAASIVAKIASKTPITPTALQAALKQPKSLGLPSYAHGHVEGFLFPATYDIQPGETASDVLKAMVTRFDQALVQDHVVAGAKQLGMSVYAVVTLASIVQHEALLLPDFPKIAEVFLNRLHANMPLGSDATELYILGPNHGPLTSADLNLNSPYNTRHNLGLPPTPIDSPGDAALNAVIHHANSQYLYFVTIDKAGHTAYATTLDRFNQLVTESQANGVS
ncbi:MAG TPA: endolytic transglycosylase MltG [Mycobacteriales bacterium]|nr:endolytic transglycosylase MltG [Mycobacteriales bacterium]